MSEIRLLAATGMLGSGFREETLKRAMTLSPDFIGVDAGTTDAVRTTHDAKYEAVSERAVKLYSGLEMFRLDYETV